MYFQVSSLKTIGYASMEPHFKNGNMPSYSKVGRAGVLNYAYHRLSSIYHGGASQEMQEF